MTFLKRLRAKQRARKARVTPCRHDWITTPEVRICTTCHVRRFGADE